MPTLYKFKSSITSFSFQPAHNLYFDSQSFPTQCLVWPSLVTNPRQFLFYSSNKHSFDPLRSTCMSTQGKEERQPKVLRNFGLWYCILWVLLIGVAVAEKKSVWNF